MSVRRKTPSKDEKLRLITVRVTEGERAELNAIARLNGMSLNEWARERFRLPSLGRRLDRASRMRVTR